MNGLAIPDDLFKKSGNQTVTGYKSFINLEFNKPVYINDLIDGVNITNFNDKKVTVHGAQNITQNVRFQNGFTVNSDLLIKGLVDNSSLDKLKENIDESMGDQVIQCKFFNLPLSNFKKFKAFLEKDRVVICYIFG